MLVSHCTSYFQCQAYTNTKGTLDTLNQFQPLSKLLPIHAPRALPATGPGLAKSAVGSLEQVAHHLSVGSKAGMTTASVCTLPLEDDPTQTVLEDTYQRNLSRLYPLEDLKAFVSRLFPPPDIPTPPRGATWGNPNGDITTSTDASPTRRPRNRLDSTNRLQNEAIPRYHEHSDRPFSPTHRQSAPLDWGNLRCTTPRPPGDQSLSWSPTYVTEDDVWTDEDYEDIRSNRAEYWGGEGEVFTHHDALGMLPGEQDTWSHLLQEEYDGDDERGVSPSVADSRSPSPEEYVSHADWGCEPAAFKRCPRPRPHLLKDSDIKALVKDFLSSPARRPMELFADLLHDPNPRGPVAKEEATNTLPACTMPGGDGKLGSHFSQSGEEDDSDVSVYSKSSHLTHRYGSITPDLEMGFGPGFSCQ